MSTDTMVTHDLYVRYTDKDGKSFVQEHRVWDAERFLNSIEAQAKKEGGKITIIDRDTYREQRA